DLPLLPPGWRSSSAGSGAGRGPPGSDDLGHRAIRAAEMLPAHSVSMLDRADELHLGGKHRRAGGIEAPDTKADDRSRGEEGVEVITRAVDLEHRAVAEPDPRHIRGLPGDRDADDVPEQADRLGVPVTAQPHEGHRIYRHWLLLRPRQSCRR